MTGPVSGRLAGLGIGAVIVVGTALGVVAVLKTDVSGRRGSGLGDAFKYDVSAYRKTDPVLIGYREVARFATGLTGPRAIAVDSSGKIFVAGGRMLRAFGPDFKLILEFQLEGEPYSIAVSDGALYLGMLDHIEVYAPDSSRLASWASPSRRSYLTSVALGDGVLFAADAGSREILCYDLSGNIKFRIASGKDGTGFLVPSPCFDVAIAPDGSLVATDPGRHSVARFSLDGALIEAWGRYGIEAEAFSGCCNPAHIAVLPDGSIATSEKGALRRIKLYGPDGSFRCIVAGTEQLGDGVQPFDLAADSRSRVLALDPEAREVRVFERLKGEGSR